MHILFLYVCEQTGVHDLELRFANMRAKSVPGEGETEYSYKDMAVPV